MPMSSASNPSPGQVNYEAYCAGIQAHLQPLWPPFPWSALGPLAQAAWEAAAEAVLAMPQVGPYGTVATRRWTPQPLHTDLEEEDADA